jgi:hypothetical protein
VRSTLTCLRLYRSFRVAAGTASGRLASDRINGETRAWNPLDVDTVGPRPAAVPAVRLGG